MKDQASTVGMLFLSILGGIALLAFGKLFLILVLAFFRVGLGLLVMTGSLAGIAIVLGILYLGACALRRLC